MEPVSNYHLEEIENIFEDCWKLYESGHKESTYSKFKDVCLTEKIHPIDIYNVFNDYIASLKPLQKDGFTKKQHEIKSLIEFLHLRLYKNSFSPPIKNNINTDKYLFGIEPFKKRTK